VLPYNSPLCGKTLLYQQYLEKEKSGKNRTGKFVSSVTFKCLYHDVFTMYLHHFLPNELYFLKYTIQQIITNSTKVKGSWGRRLLAVAGEVTRHGRAHPYSWSITIVSLRSKESEESHRSEWKTKLLSIFLAVTCQHASGACQSHSRPVLNLREALRKYVELFTSTLPFLTLQFYVKDLTPTPNLLRISGRYSLCLGISFQSSQGHLGDWVSRMILLAYCWKSS
jgi:hypothetical protein